MIIKKNTVSWPFRYWFSCKFWCLMLILFIGSTHQKTTTCRFRVCWTPDMSFDAVFLQLSTDQQEGEQRAASQQQSTLITVRAISKNPDEGYKGPRVYRGVFITRSSPYLFFFFHVWWRKGTKEVPYWLKTSRTVKQQDTTDRSCMAGIRIKVERAWRRKRTTKETGDWQTFFFVFCAEKDGMKGLVIWKDKERTITNQRQSFLASARLHSGLFLTGYMKDGVSRVSGDQIGDSYARWKRIVYPAIPFN